VIASGGVGKLDHLAEGCGGRADGGFLAASIHFGEFSPWAAAPKEYMQSVGSKSGF